jgi:glucose/arabinose dehydrogenase
MLSFMKPEIPQKTRLSGRRLNLWLAGLAAAALLTACSLSSAPVPEIATPQPTALDSPPVQPAAPGKTPQTGVQATQVETPSAPSGQADASTATAPRPEKTAAPASPARPAARPSAFPDPKAYTWQTVASGLQRPLALSGDRQGRLLVLEQPGRIRLVDASGLLPTPFMDISARVGSKGNEQGLLGIALHPKYTQNGFFYVNYTDLQGNTVIARYTAGASRNSASPDSEQILLRVKQPYANHNGGSLAFGPDGFLYMGLGDGGSAGDPQGNGQNLNSLLGKLLRIDINQGSPYTIPDGNPFKGGGGKPEIWAYGLRNPWRFSFDRATGDLYIGDVGQDTWEEIDFLPAGSPGGSNFGWNFREGLHDFKGSAPAGLVMTDPIFEYKHPTGCSVSGGSVYRGAAIAEMQGIYLFGDYCNGKIWGLLRGADGQWQNKLLFQSGAFLSSFGEDDQGEMYLTDNNAGVVLKLVKK